MNFDVFLSHNSKDKPAVRTLGKALKDQGLKVWLDEWELRPGLTWQNALEDILTGCKSATVCFGGSGVGPWEEPEMQALLRRFVNEKKDGNVVPIIPVLLPGAPADVKLPLFLEAFTWVDLRNGLTADGLERLRWGITGEKPRENTPTVCFAKVTPDLRKARDTVVNYLTSDKLNVLPAKPYSGDPCNFLPALEADLDQANVFVQILGAYYADRTEELPEGEELAQFRQAQESGKVILQWRDKSVDLDAIDDPQHQDLVGGANVVCNDLTEFAKQVADRAKRVHDVGRLAFIKPDKVEADEVSQHVFLGYCSSSRSTAASLKNFLQSTGTTVLDWQTDFIAGRSILAQIKEAASRCNAGIFLFTKDDDLADRVQLDVSALRDNLVFAVGYFIGKKGKRNVLIVREQGSTKMPADLGGDIYALLLDKVDIGSIERVVSGFIAAL